jgi:hypothetical protein
MQLKMSSDNLHEILGTYSEIEALKKFTRLECLAPDLGTSEFETVGKLKAAECFISLKRSAPSSMFFRVS